MHALASLKQVPFCIYIAQGIQEYNGGAVLGMAGKDCVAVACDMRYGAQMQTMAIDKNKVFKMHDRYTSQLTLAEAEAHPLSCRLFA